MGRPSPASSLLAIPSPHAPERKIISHQDISLHWQKDEGRSLEGLILAFTSANLPKPEQQHVQLRKTFEQAPTNGVHWTSSRPLGWAMCHLFLHEPFPEVQMMTLGSSHRGQFHACCPTVALRFLSYMSWHSRFLPTPREREVQEKAQGWLPVLTKVAGRGCSTQHLSHQQCSSCVWCSCSATERNGKG